MLRKNGFELLQPLYYFFLFLFGFVLFQKEFGKADGTKACLGITFEATAIQGREQEDTSFLI